MPKKNVALVFGITDNYVFALCNVFFGLKKYHKIPFWDDIIVLHNDVSNVNQNIICSILPSKFIDLSKNNDFNRINQELQEKCIDVYSATVMYRFYCISLLSKYKKVIWNDCDILIQNDISDLIKFGEKSGYAACQSLEKIPLLCCFDKPIENYDMLRPNVNSGLIVFSEHLPNYEEIYKWCIQMAIDLSKDICWPDQAILNLMLQHFNIQLELINNIEYQCHPLHQDSVCKDKVRIVHAYGGEKFWNSDALGHKFPEWKENNKMYKSIKENFKKIKVLNETEKKEGEPLVSVVMSLYKRSKYFKEAFQSISEQTYNNLEIIIVLEQSEIQDMLAKEIEKIDDERVVLIKNRTKLGFAESLNVGIRAAKGTYIARMDDDDYSEPERIDKEVAFLEKNPDVGIVGTYVRTFGERTEEWRYETDPQKGKVMLLFDTILCHSSVMIRKSVLDLNHLYYRSGRECEDYDLWARASEVTKITVIPEFLLNFRLTNENVTFQRKDDILRADMEIQKEQIIKHLHFVPTYDEVRLMNTAFDIYFLTFQKNKNDIIKMRETLGKKILKKNKKYKYYEQAALKDCIFDWSMKHEKNLMGFIKKPKGFLKRCLKRLYYPYKKRYYEPLIRANWLMERNLSQTEEVLRELRDLMHTEKRLRKQNEGVIR